MKKYLSVATLCMMTALSHGSDYGEPHDLAQGLHPSGHAQHVANAFPWGMWGYPLVGGIITYKLAMYVFDAGPKHTSRFQNSGSLANDVFCKSIELLAFGAFKGMIGAAAFATGAVAGGMIYGAKEWYSSYYQ